MLLKPSSVAKTIRTLLKKCSMDVPVNINPPGASSWENEGGPDTAVEVGGKTAVIPSYVSEQLQAVKIINGEYIDLGYASKNPFKVGCKVVAAYVEICLRSSSSINIE